MPTRFYFGTTLTEVPLTPSSNMAGWNVNGTINKKILRRKNGYSNSSIGNVAAPGVSGQFVRNVCFISDALDAQTIDGTIKGQFLCNEQVAGDNFTLAVGVRVIRPDRTDRGVLLAVTASDDTSSTPPEMSDAVATNRSLQDSSENFSLTLSSLAVSAGDYLVIEIGIREASTSVNTASIYASNNSTDLPEDQIATTGDAWIEFSDDITFIDSNNYYYASASTYLANSANPTAVTPPVGMLPGDLVLMVGEERATGATLAIQADGGQSWNALNAISTTNVTARVFWCVFNGTWGANPSINFGTAVCNSVAMHVFRPPAQDYTWSINQALVELDIAAAATQTIVGQTTTGTNHTITFAGWCTADDNAWYQLSGTGWETTGLSSYANGAGSDMSMTFAHKIQTAAGATGNVSKTQQTGGNDAATTFIVTFAMAAPTPSVLPNNSFSMMGVGV